MYRLANRSLAGLLVVALALTGLLIARPERAFADDPYDQPYMGQGYTKEQILTKWADRKPTGTGTAFSNNPSAAAPFSAGTLTDQAMTNGLNTWNFARWLAGLQDISLYATYNSNMAVGALVNAANDALTHFPEQPPGMSAELYEKGAAACRQANLFYAWSSADTLNNTELMAQSVLAWLDDSDDWNVKALGHRRWMLYPQMVTSGFGAAYTAFPAFPPSTTPAYYTACQVMGLGEDSSRAKSIVQWPAAGYFPFEFFEPSSYFHVDQAWSVSLDPAVYGKKYTSGINVTMTELGGGTETFAAEVISETKIFTVETSGYGTDFCIIFRPGTLTPAVGKAYDITVSGLRTPADAPASNIVYHVKFFSLSETVPVRKSVSVGTQAGTLVAGTAGSAHFDVTSAQIADGIAGSVSWFTADDGLIPASAPAGLTSSVSSILHNAAVVTIEASTETLAGIYYFKVTVDGATSDISTLTIGAPAGKYPYSYDLFDRGVRTKQTDCYGEGTHTVWLPTRDAIGGYAFAGWILEGGSFVDGQTTAPDFVASFTLEVGPEIDLPEIYITYMAIYTRAEGGMNVYTANPLQRGDANCDGTVDASDAALILRYIVKLDTLTPLGFANALLTGGTEPTAADAARILRWIVKLETSP